MSPFAIGRRAFLKAAVATLAGPYVVPCSVFGKAAPSNTLTMGCIGVGRRGMAAMRSFLDLVRVVAVCDVDANRAANAKATVERHYAERLGKGRYVGCDAHHDFRDLVVRSDIDTCLIATPDHWHVLPALAAARHGKDIYVEKPLTLTIAEGRVLADTVRRYGVVLQVGSQQRSDSRFRHACELARNGRVGKIHTVTVGIGTDPGCAPQPVMPVPKGLDYDFWLGPAPWAPYTEKRVHPQKGYSRPGWLRITDYSGGMMTGWGSHHNDIAQWGLGTEYTGPVEIRGNGAFPRDGLWDVHGKFHVEARYASGVRLIITSDAPNGVRFEGDEGWVFVTRGRIAAQPKSLLDETIGPREIHLYRSNNHVQNFVDCVRTRQDPIANVEVGHRSATVCHLGNIAMWLGRTLRFDPVAETFPDDATARAMLRRSSRAPWAIG